MRYVWLVLAACGRVGFDPASNGTTNDAGSVDAGPLGPFGTPSLVTTLADPEDDDDPCLTGDMLEIYFSSYRVGAPGGGDIWRATRPDSGAAWSAPTQVAEINTTSLEENPGVASDGLTLWFSSDRSGQVDIYVASRSDRTAPWTSITLVPELSTALEELGASPDASLLRLVFNRGAPPDLHEAIRARTDQQWSARRILELSTPSEESSPFLARPTVIYFSSDRDGGAPDLYVASRPTTAEPFEAPVPVVELNSSANDDDPWLSPDERTVFFMSARSGNEEIYMATR